VVVTTKEMNRQRVLQGCMDGKMLIGEAARRLKRSLRSVPRRLAKVAHSLIATIIRFTCPCAKERRSLETNTPYNLSIMCPEVIETEF
jgi:hypothetical protein